MARKVYYGVDGGKLETVDYVESNGTQYIDTGIIPNQDTKVEIECVFPTTTQLQYSSLFGAQNTGNGTECFSIFTARNLGARTGDSGSISTGVPLEANKHYSFALEYNKLTINGTEYTGELEWTTAVNYSLYLFTRNAMNDLSLMVNMYSVARVYNCKIYDKGTLVRDFVPARDMNGVFCLYDKISQTRFYSLGTEQLQGGYLKEARKVSYLESSGTQYIDTGFVPNQNTRIMLEFQYLSTSHIGRLFGTRNTGSDSNTQCFAFGTWGTENIAYYSAYGSEELGYDLIDLNRHTVDFNKNNVYIDDVLKHTFGEATFDGYGSIYLFTYNTQSISANAMAKIFSCKIYDGDILVRDFVPYLDEFGEACLKDLVSNAYYYNKGTGIFKSGGFGEARQIAYIETNGNQYIDTGFNSGGKETLDNNFELDVKILKKDSGWLFSFGDNRNKGMHPNTETDNEMYWYTTSSGSNTKIKTFKVNYMSRVYYKSGYNNYLANTMTANGVNKVLTGYPDSSPSTGANLFLFAKNNGGIAENFSSCRFYSFKFYHQSKVTGSTLELVRHYVPYIDKYGVYCLKDLVEDKLYYSQGTEAFSGAVAESGTQLDYIETTGEQYIKTGFVANQDTKVEIEFTPLSKNTAGVFCDMENKLTRAFNLLILDGQFRLDYNTTSSLITAPLVKCGDRYKVILDKGNGYINDGLVYTGSYGTFTTPREMILFATTHENEAYEIEDYLGNFATLRFHSCKIYDNGTLVRDYIPYQDIDGIYCLYDNIGKKCYYSANGTNFTYTDLTSIETIEIPGVAREVKKLYYGINGIARKIKKGYIGVNGIARLFYRSEYKLSKNGSTIALAGRRCKLGGAANSNYALFGGGEYSPNRSDTYLYADVVAINKNLVKSSAPDLSLARRRVEAGGNQNYVIFAGGSTYTSSSDKGVTNADAYDNNLTKVTVSALSEGKYDHAVTTLNNIIIFAGGNSQSSYTSETLEAYSLNLTKSTLNDFSIGSYGNAGASNSNYAIFSSGYRGSYNGKVIAYNKNLVKSTTSDLSLARNYAGAASTEKYVVFAGGDAYKTNGSGSEFNTTADAYNENLVKVSVPNLSASRNNIEGCNGLGFMLFGGGDQSNTSSLNRVVDVYNENLVRTTTTSLSASGGKHMASASLGKYVLFAGGWSGKVGSSYCASGVDIYISN